MSSISSEATPYERGVAHLKRAEYSLAVVAFTEAIRLEPDAPNGFAGRSLAYRLQGDEAAALQDRQAAQALGGPERSVWDRLVNRAHRRWHGDLSNPEWRQIDPLSHNAVLLRQWVWQIYNGGLPQWVANGYGEWALELAQAAEEVGTEATRSVAKVIRAIAVLLTKWPTARDLMFQMIADPSAESSKTEALFLALSDCEAAYSSVGPSFSANVEAWFERQASNSP